VTVEEARFWNDGEKGLDSGVTVEEARFWSDGCDLSPSFQSCEAISGIQLKLAGKSVDYGGFFANHDDNVFPTSH